jgi:multimeric flavodoxin WrbA
MKALGIAFSARKRGNCLSCLEYVIRKLKNRGFKTEIINCYEHEIRPCSHCNYECFSRELRNTEETCPIQDDVPMIYQKITAANIIIFAVPTYGGNISALYRAWSERAQGVFKSYSEFIQALLRKVVAFIVIGNVPDGATLTYHTIVEDFANARIPPAGIVLQPEEYGMSSLRGDLVANEQVKKRLDNLVKMIITRWQKLKQG